MTMHYHEGYTNGARFACAYAQSYGVTDAVRSLRTLEQIEPPAYVAGVCDALLDILQGDTIPCSRRTA